MRSAIIVRLKKLEAKAPPSSAYSRAWNKAFKAALAAVVAFHIGRWREHEPPLDALKRALGEIPTGATMKEKIMDALDTLFVSRGWHFFDGEESAIWADIGAPLNQLLDETPATLRCALGAPASLGAPPSL
jgi:hypothetical protein